MTDPAVYLEKLSAFSRMLRLEGLAVSPKETADGAQILTVLGFEDREQVKTALRTIYAKSREEQALFDRVFDGFFLSEEAMRAQAKEQARIDLETAQAKQEILESVQVHELNDAQMDTYAAMPKEVRKKLQRIMDKYGNSERNPELYTNFIHSVFAKTLLEQQMRMEDAGLGGDALDPDTGLLYRDISKFQDTDIPKAISIIQTLTRQLNGELTAKRNKGGHSGKLDFRRTIRKGLETGGSFYRLKYKKKRNRRKQLVLLCDVSGSMVQFSEFALRFIQALNQASESSRVFLFSETMFEADAFSLQNMDLFRNYVKEWGLRQGYGFRHRPGATLRHDACRPEFRHHPADPFGHQDCGAKPGSRGADGCQAAGRAGALAQPTAGEPLAACAQRADLSKRLPHGVLQHFACPGRGLPGTHFSVIFSRTASAQN